MVETVLCQLNLVLFLQQFPSCHLFTGLLAANMGTETPSHHQTLFPNLVFVAQMCNLQLVSKNRQCQKCSVFAITPFSWGLLIFQHISVVHMDE